MNLTFRCCLLCMKLFLILSDPLSSIKAIFNLKFDHPILGQILELYMNLTKEGKDIVFIWVPGHVGIRGNSPADYATKDALAGDISVELIPFSDLKSPANKYILALWQSEWDEFPGNKLHKIFPFLKECVVCPQTNRKEETVIAQLDIGHFFGYSFLFIEGWGTANVHRMWWTFNYWTYFTDLFRCSWNKWEPL